MAKLERNNILTATVPSDGANFPTSQNYNAEWGIDNQLSGFIIQNESFNKERVTDTTQGQKGCVVAQLDYDVHYTLTLNVIGNGDLPEEGDIDFPYPAWKDNRNRVDWKVQSVNYQGAYNDKKKYTINCERWANWPQQESPESESDSNP